MKIFPSRLVILMLLTLNCAAAMAQSIVVNASEYSSLKQAFASCRGSSDCTVLIPEGTYEVFESLPMINNLTVIGLGPVRIKASDTVSPFPIFHYIATVGKSYEIAEPVTNAAKSIRVLEMNNEIVPGDVLKIGGGIPGDEQPGYAIQVESVTHDRIHFRHAAGSELSLDYLSKMTLLKNVKISNLTIEGNGTFVVELHGADDIVFRNVNFTGATSKGPFISYSNDIVLERCKFYDIFYGLRAFGTNSFQVRGCDFDSVISTNIGMEYCNNSQIYGNRINASWAQLAIGISGDGLSLKHGWGNVFSNNRIESTSCYGVWIIGNNGRNIIENNQTSNTFTSGIRIDDGIENVIRFNEIKNVPGDSGLVIVNCQDTIIQNNYLENVWISFYMEGSRRGIITGNTGSNNGHGTYVILLANSQDIFRSNSW